MVTFFKPFFLKELSIVLTLPYVTYGPGRGKTSIIVTFISLGGSRLFFLQITGRQFYLAIFVLWNDRNSFNNQPEDNTNI
jgi:hypothetical protein